VTVIRDKGSHVMIDLETLGTGPDAAVVSIGACRFNINTGEIQSRFHEKVQFSPTMGKIDPATVLWWFQQSEEARAALISGQRLPLIDVLKNFRHWVNNGDCEFGNVAGLWSNGPTFDETILRHAFGRFDLHFGVSFRLSRCCRTFFMLAQEFGIKPTPALIKHDALDDAIAQAKTVCAVYERISRSKTGAEL